MAPTRATITCHQNRTAPHQPAVLMSICATPLQTPPGYLSVNTQSPHPGSDSARLGERPRPGAGLAPQPSRGAHPGVAGISEENLRREGSGQGGRVPVRGPPTLWELGHGFKGAHGPKSAEGRGLGKDAEKGRERAEDGAGGGYARGEAGRLLPSHTRLQPRCPQGGESHGEQDDNRSLSAPRWLGQKYPPTVYNSQVFTDTPSSPFLGVPSTPPRKTSRSSLSSSGHHYCFTEKTDKG